MGLGGLEIDKPDIEAIQELIFQFPEFEGVELQTVRYLAEHAEWDTFKERATFLREDVKSEHVYLLLKGSVVMFRKQLPSSDKKERLLLGRLSSPTILGEVEMTLAGINCSTVRAITELAFLKIPTAVFKKTCDLQRHSDSPYISARLAWNIGVCLATKLEATINSVSVQSSQTSYYRMAEFILYYADQNQLRPDEDGFVNIDNLPPDLIGKCASISPQHRRRWFNSLRNRGIVRFGKNREKSPYKIHLDLFRKEAQKLFNSQDND